MVFDAWISHLNTAEFDEQNTSGESLLWDGVKSGVN